MVISHDRKITGTKFGLSANPIRKTAHLSGFSVQSFETQSPSRAVETGLFHKKPSFFCDNRLIDFYVDL